MAAEHTLDLVLMDLQLPGIDGTETHPPAAAGTLDPRVPVVAVTASRWRRTTPRRETAGFDAYLEKPISVRGAGRPGAKRSSAGAGHDRPRHRPRRR